MEVPYVDSFRFREIQKFLKFGKSHSKEEIQICHILMLITFLGKGCLGLKIGIHTWISFLHHLGTFN